jgi:hypothetical protein
MAIESPVVLMVEQPRIASLLSGASLNLLQAHGCDRLF